MAPLQLIIRGKPSSFDLSPSHDIVAVSSPGCITLFNINGFGSPKYVIHYEQPQQIRQLKFQRSHHQLMLAALRGQGLSIWDPNNAMKPLTGLINSKGWITDIDWSWGDPSLLVTSCDRGEIRLFDIRKSYDPVQKFVQSDAFVRGVEWSSSNGYLFTSICNDTSLSAWDTRTASESDPKKYKSIQFDNTIIQARWGPDSSLAVGTSNGAIEWWNIHADYNLNGSEVSINRESILRPPIVEQTSAILPTSVGKGVVVSKLISDDTIDIRLHGYARDGQDLGRVFQDPSTDIYSDGPSLSLCQSRDSIIGMRWGTPGRLCPPAHAGMELLIFTESCVLHPVKISADVVHKYCGGSSNILSRDPVKHRNNSMRKTQLVPDVINGHKYLPKYFLEDVKTRTANKLSIGSSEENPGSIISFDRAGSPSITMDSIYGNSYISEIFWRQLKEDFSYLENLSNDANLSHLACQLDEGSRLLILTVSRQLSSGITNRSAFSETMDASQDVSLLVSFPVTISMETLPTYHIKPYPTDNQMADSLVAELISITKVSISQTSADENSSYRNPELTDDTSFKDSRTGGYLLDIASTFRNYILQDWESKYENDNFMVEEKANENKDVKLADHIDEKSYKIPSPSSSGARFSAGGQALHVKPSMLASRKSASDLDPIHRSQSGNMSELSRNVSNSQLVASTTRSRNASIDSKDPVAVSIMPRPSLSMVTVYQQPQNLSYSKSYGEFLIQRKMAEEKARESILYDQAMHADNLRQDDAKSTLSYLSLASSRSKLSDTQLSLLSTSESKLSKRSPSEKDPKLQSGEVVKGSLIVSTLNDSRECILSAEDGNNSIESTRQIAEINFSWHEIRSYVITEVKEQLLAHSYVLGPKNHNMAFDNDADKSKVLADICRNNGEIARKYQCSAKIIQAWELLAVSLEIVSIPEITGGLISWFESSLGYPLAKRLISYLLMSGDHVTLASAICVLGGSRAVRELLTPNDRLDGTSRRIVVSLPEPFSNLDQLEIHMENVIVQYADYLYRWCSWVKATEVRNYFSSTTMASLEEARRSVYHSRNRAFITNQHTFNVDWHCSRCGDIAVYKDKVDEYSTNIFALASAIYQSSSSFRGIAGGQSYFSYNSDDYDEEEDNRLWCNSCKQYAITCGFCQMPVREISYTCMICGHGGHPEHMKAWFEQSLECPTGCGCTCRDTDLIEESNQEISKNSFKKQKFVMRRTPSETDYDMGELPEEVEQDFTFHNSYSGALIYESEVDESDQDSEESD